MFSSDASRYFSRAFSVYDRPIQSYFGPVLGLGLSNIPRKKNLSLNERLHMLSILARIGSVKDYLGMNM